MSNDAKLERHLKLSNPNLTFAGKFKLAASIELDYWESRTEKPNIPLAVFRTIYPHIPDSVVPRFEPRQSGEGEHGTDGEDSVFNFEFPFFAHGKEIWFYCKGYFFEKDFLRGVTVQSFRSEKPRGKVIQMRRSP
jgi:hypothetical protein